MFRLESRSACVEPMEHRLQKRQYPAPQYRGEPQELQSNEDGMSKVRLTKGILSHVDWLTEIGNGLIMFCKSADRLEEQLTLSFNMTDMVSGSTRRFPEPLM